MKQMQKGFTLIELMIVVAIIGILAAVAIPAYQDYVIKSKLSKLQSTMDPIKLAIGMFYQETGQFPGGNTATAAAQVTVANTTTATTDAYWNSLGLMAFPNIPKDVVSTLDLSTTANSASVVFTVVPQNIKAGACAAAGAAPASTAGIDGCTLVITGTPGPTAIEWTYSGTVMGNSIAAKYFK